jgi:hypothetical protein
VRKRGKILVVIGIPRIAMKHAPTNTPAQRTPSCSMHASQQITVCGACGVRQGKGDGNRFISLLPLLSLLFSPFSSLTHTQYSIVKWIIYKN